MLAISSGAAMRPCRRAINARAPPAPSASSNIVIAVCCIGVSTNAGSSALERTLEARNSAAVTRLRWLIPALDMPYAAVPPTPTWPANDDMLTMAPPPRSTILGAACLVHSHAPRRLIPMTRSKSLTVVSMSEAR